MDAFVLTGGGSLGAVHAGMLQALYERDVAPDLIVGTSVGAINGGYIASRPPTVETAASLAAVWRGLRRAHVFPMDFASGFLGFAGRRKHLIPSRGLRRIVERHLEFSDLADAPVPLHVVATDAANGEEIALSHGDAVNAILASAAIPGILPPVPWNGRLLVDGGVANYAPISHAVAQGADKVFVLTSGTACGLDEPPRGAIPLLLHTTSFLVTRRLVVEIEHLRDSVDLVVLPPPCPLNVPPHDFSQANHLVTAAASTTGAFLDRLPSLDRPPVPRHLSLVPHHRRSLTI